MANQAKEVKEIVYATLKDQVEVQGMKKKELAAYYGISVLQMTKALQATGLRIKQNHYPTFKIVGMETETAPVAEVTEATPSTEVLAPAVEEANTAPTEVIDAESVADVAAPEFPQAPEADEQPSAPTNSIPDWN